MAELQGHTDKVMWVDFSPDGKSLVSSSGDGTLQMWNTENGEKIGEAMKEHEGEINCARFSPCGTMIASAAVDKFVIIWNAKKQTMIKKLELPDRIFCVAWSPSFFAAGCYDGKIYIYCVATYDRVGILQGHENCVRDLAFFFRFDSCEWFRGLFLSLVEPGHDAAKR